jgi:hypothetical protein
MAAHPVGHDEQTPAGMAAFALLVGRGVGAEVLILRTDETHVSAQYCTHDEITGGTGMFGGCFTHRGGGLLLDARLYVIRRSFRSERVRDGAL